MLRARAARSREMALNHEERVGWIERRCRLVEEERLRIAQQRSPDRHALLLASGECRGLAVEKLRLEPDFIECRYQSVLREIAWYAEQGECRDCRGPSLRTSPASA